MKPTFVITFAAALSGCVAGLGDAPPGAPPSPLPEVRSLATAPGMVWVAGAGTGTTGDWVWIPGRWETPPPVPMGETPKPPVAPPPALP